MAYMCDCVREFPAQKPCADMGSGERRYAVERLLPTEPEERDAFLKNAWKIEDFDGRLLEHGFGRALVYRAIMARMGEGADKCLT